MKNIILAIFYLLFGLVAFSQQNDAPGVAWRIVDCSEQHPNSPVFTSSSIPPLPPGSPVKLHQETYPNGKSGKEGWNSVIPVTLAGVEHYYAVGYSSYIHYEYDDNCYSAMPDSFSFSLPILMVESLSKRLAAAALFTKEGKIVWYKEFLLAENGAVSAITDLEGNLYFTGNTYASKDLSGAPILVNPFEGVGAVPPHPEFCDLTNHSRPFIAKVSPDGNLLWCYQYSSTGYHEYHFHHFDFKQTAIDLLLTNDQQIVLVGDRHAILPGPLRHGFFLSKFNLEGDILLRRTITQTSNYFSIQSIRKHFEYFLVSGSTRYNSRIHGFVVKINSDFDVSTDFGNEYNYLSYIDANGSQTNHQTKSLYLRNEDYPNGGSSNIVYDTKTLSNNRIALAVGFDIKSSEGNHVSVGIGKLLIFEVLGQYMLTSATINIFGDGYITGESLKMSITGQDPSDLTVISTVKDGDMNTPEHKAILQQSRVVITHIPNELPPKSLGVLAGFLGRQVEYFPRDGSESFVQDQSFTSALITNIHINSGVIRWEKVVDAHDGPLQVYPGDWKKRNNVFKILKDQDGNYVFAGNSSANKDDFYLAKLHGNCQLDIEYDVEPLEITTNPELHLYGGSLSGILVWDSIRFDTTDINVRGEIHVMPNQTLIISPGMKVHFASSTHMHYRTKLVVRPGARLIIDNATLTSVNCDDNNTVWQGIELWGNRELPQTTQNQGFVEIRNGATIEHAAEAIQVWKPKDGSSTGGIIEARDAIFLNNKRDIQFMNYLPQSEGALVKNRSFFDNTKFLTNNDFRFGDIFAHVTMNNVYGVDYLACHFEDERTGIEHYNRGISSIDASYNVLGKDNNELAHFTADFDTEQYQTSLFKNFDHGIYSRNSVSFHTIHVDQAEFTNTRIGVHISDVLLAKITRNLFHNTFFSTDFQEQVGIYSDYSSGFKVEGNTVNFGSFTPRPAYGVMVLNSGGAANRIYRNHFYRNEFASVAKFRNRNFEIKESNLHRGLEYICNNFYTSRAQDIRITGNAINDGIKLSQGRPQLSAGNVFTSNASVTNIANYTFQPIDYFYWLYGYSEYPQIVTNVDRFQTNSRNYCYNSFGNSLYTPEYHDELVTNYYRIDDEIDILSDQVDWDAYVHDPRNNSIIFEQLQELTDQKQEIVQTILLEIVHEGKGPLFQEVERWLPYREDPLYLAYSVDLALFTDNREDLDQRLDRLYKEAIESKNDELRREMLDFYQFKRDLLHANNYKSNLKEITEEIENIIRYYAQEATGLAQKQAQNLLCFYFDECPEIDFKLEQEAIQPKSGYDEQAEYVLEQEYFELYPIPTEQSLTLKQAGPVAGNVTIYTLAGVRVANFSIQHELTVVDVSKLENGIYILQLENELSKTSKKFVKE